MKPLGPENFPPSRFFLTRGFASMRSDWSKDATFVHFRCGAFGGLGDNRHNADNNTFTLYKKGILALDTGAQHTLDSVQLKFDPPNDRPNVAYSAETIAHNGILIHHADDDLFWKLYGKVNTGALISDVFPITDWEQAFARHQDKNGIKVVLTPVD